MKIHLFIARSMASCAVLAVALTLYIGAAVTSRAQSIQVMHVFDTNILMNAAAAENALVVGPDGTLYGTSQGGGAYGDGAVYLRATNGAVRTLYSFTGGADGSTPWAGLTLGADGNLYGSAEFGGANGNGVIFRITGNSFAVIHTFAASMTNSAGVSTNADGTYCVASMISGPDGALYGTTADGGAGNAGTVFRITTNGDFETLHSFAAFGDGYVNADGVGPVGGLAFGADGRLYGSAIEGGINGRGTLFRIENGVFTVLYMFSQSGGGMFPFGPLVLAGDGNLHGSLHFGNIFGVTTNGDVGIANWGPPSPDSPGGVQLTAGLDGNLYGIGFNGVTSVGNVFELSGGFPFSTYAFTGGADGSQPTVPLAVGPDGNFYGITLGGGANGLGTMYKIAPAGDFTLLYAYSTNVDGADPKGGLALAGDGKVYGATDWGGASNTGTIYSLNTNGAFSVVYSFTVPSYADFTFTNENGANPQTGLTLAGDGNLYGTTPIGGTGSNGGGTVYRVTTNGTVSTVYNFSGVTETPLTPLALAPDGSLYGSTQNGFPGGFGGVFQVTTDGDFNVIYTPPQENPPVIGPTVTVGADGHVYGVGVGVSPAGCIFRLDGGTLNILHSFTGGMDGSVPGGALIQGAGGTFYGTTSGGGSNNMGTVFKITPGGTFTSLYSFTGGADGGSPMGSLAFGLDGRLYGTASTGGFYGNGTVFRLTTNGVFTTLTAFANTNGANPAGGVTLGADGNFYGTTGQGGTGQGVIFRLIAQTGTIAPFIVQNPTNVDVMIGGSAAFSAGAIGDPTLSYQWYFNNAAIGGATNTTVMVSAASTNATGNYRVVVTNYAGSATSSVATLTVWRPRVVVFARDFNNVFHFALSSLPGSTNRLLVTTNLSAPDWQPVDSGVAQENGVIPNLIDLGATNSPMRFYRVVSP